MKPDGVPGAGNDRLRFDSIAAQTTQPTFAQDVAAGLTAAQKWLSPKYFYDEIGSQLYEQICELPEYYPYRAERNIFIAHAADIVGEISDLALVELGAGSSTKTRYLLDCYEQTQQPFTYCPIDISPTMLQETAAQLLADYEYLTIHALHADFAGHPEVIQSFDHAKKAVAFFGSSLGNFTREESAEFVAKTARLLGSDDVFLLGIDLQKSTDILVPAYDDAQGVTAAFNLNVLTRINRELGGQFDLDTFEHVAFYNAAQGRIEMHLRSQLDQRIPITKIEHVIAFEAGETIHTENSCKYTVEEIEALGQQAGLHLSRTWFDPQHYFLLALFRPS